MKADEPRQNRIPFMVSDSELEALDRWRFANHVATRAEAIRRLCVIGLVADNSSSAIERYSRDMLTAARLLYEFASDRDTFNSSSEKDELIGRAADILHRADDLALATRRDHLHVALAANRMKGKERDAQKEYAKLNSLIQATIDHPGILLERNLLDEIWKELSQDEWDEYSKITDGEKQSEFWASKIEPKREAILLKLRESPE